MTAIAIRTLAPGDETALEAFLAPRWRSAMFLRANARAAGLVDGGRPSEGTYVAAWRDGAILSVVAHFWNGVLALAAPSEGSLVRSLVQAATAQTGRRVAGLAGATLEVEAALAALGLEQAPVREREDLFALSLGELRLPPQLADGTWRCRAPRPDERDQLAAWRADYAQDPGARDRFVLDDVMRVLVVDGEPVAFCTFIATLPDVVQVGGVYTPPAWRRRQYARAVVAGALDDARGRGVAQALLFTAVDNVAARRAYTAIGFAVDAGVTLLTL